jgi:MFS family permease
MFGALRHYNFRLWATADLISVTGTWMQVLGVNWYLLQATGSAVQMGLGILLQSLPMLLLSPYAGAVADRIRPRPLLLLAQLAHAGLAAALALIVFTGSHAVWPVYLIALLNGAVTAVDGPALGRFGSMLVGPKSLGNALALGSLINSTGRIAGMSLGGLLVAATGAGWLFAGNAASYLAIVAALLLMRPREWHPLASSADAPTLDEGVRAGLAYLLRQPAVVVMLALALVLGCFGRNYQVTMAAMSAGPLHAGAAGYGLLSTVFAVGTVVGALVAAHRSELPHRLLLAAGLLASALQLVSGLAPSLITFAVVLLPIAAAAVVIDTTVTARAQLDTREDMRGRVVSAVAVVGSLSGMLGAPLLGWLSERQGPRAALILAGALCLGACGAAAALLARFTAAPTSSPARYASSSQPATTASAVTAVESTDTPITASPNAASYPYSRARITVLNGARPVTTAHAMAGTDSPSSAYASSGAGSSSARAATTGAAVVR